MNRKKLLISLAVTTALFVIISLFFDYRFDINDDSAIQSILSGRFTGSPTGYAVYIQYPLALLISLLCRILPVVPWFSVLIQGLHFVCVFLVVYRMMTISSGIISKIINTILLVCFFLGIMLTDLVFTQYTVTAAIVISTCAFLIATDDLTDKKRNIGYAVMCVLCFCIRSKMFLLALPYLGFLLFVKLVNNPRQIKETLKRYMTFVAMCLGMVLVVFLINKIAYSVNGWGDFSKFNAARTELYDYLSLPKYDEHKEVYDAVNVSEDEYTLLQSYNIEINENIDTDYLTTLNGEISNFVSSEVSVKERLSKAFIQYKYRTLHDQDYPWNLCVFALYGIWFLMILLSKKYGYLFLPVLCGLMRSCIWMYIIYAGRYPARITDSLYILEIGVLFGCIVYQYSEYRLSEYIVSISAVLLAVVCLIAVPHSIATSNSKNTAALENDAKYASLMEYIQESDSIYYLDIYTMVSYSEKMFCKQSEYQNYRFLGGWTIHSPLIESRKAYEQDNGLTEAYFVVDTKNLHELSGCYYSFLDAEPVYRIGEFLIYKY